MIMIEELNTKQRTESTGKSKRNKVNRKKPKKNERHSDDVMTKQDMDMISGIDNRSHKQVNAQNDTFSSERYAMHDLESEMDEMTLVAMEQKVSSVRLNVATKEEKKKTKNRKKREKVETQQVHTKMSEETKKKVKQAQNTEQEGETACSYGDDTQNNKKTTTTPNLQSKKTQVLPLNSKIHVHSKKRVKKDARRIAPINYADYMDLNMVLRGLEMGCLFQGKLRVNSMYRMDGYISVDGLSVDVLTKGMQDRNRALDGDLVAIRLHPENEWKLLNDDSERRTLDAIELKSLSSSVGVDENVLHSLWLPSVQPDDQCFFKRPSEEDPADMLKTTRALLNERIKLSRRRPTATVVFILARDNANGFVGSLQSKTKVRDVNLPLSGNDNYAFLNANDLRLPRLIRIPRLQLPDEFIHRPLLYSKTMLCFCRITAWPTKHFSPTGEFVKTVGEYTGIETSISAALFQHGLQAHTLDFDSSILNDLDEKYGTSGEKWAIPEEEIQKRRDFRETQIFSIDPYNARDLDDALHILALNDTRTKFEIGVHIADVAHFIEHNSLLDLEARSRGTSVYLVNRVLPMLPRVLCEKLCSLQPQVDRLAFSVVWQMNSNGTLVEGVEPWFGKSLIRSCCKLDYGSAQKMLDGTITEEFADEWEVDRRPVPGATPNITNATVIQSVKDLWSIGESRRAMRSETGAVSLYDVKLVFSLDAKGNPIQYGPYELKNSNRLVEEYMLLANYLVAQQLLRAHGPLAFLRHHPPPILRSMDQTLEKLTQSNVKLGGRSTKQLTESLKRIRYDCGETVFATVQALLIKPMKPAMYMVADNGASPDSWRHYALNIPYYTHFTSPIRRYADIVVHRLLQESLADGFTSNNDALNSAVAESKMVELTSVAQHCIEKKMTSKNAETECDKVFLCAFVRHHGDIEVTGIVLSMGQKSFTVYILELGFEERLFLEKLHLSGSWNRKTLQLSIKVPQLRKVIDEKERIVETDHEEEDYGKEKMTVSSSLLIELSFLKELRLSVSTTRKMPLMLTFTVLGVKT